MDGISEAAYHEGQADPPAQESGVGHDPRDATLFHLWKASKYYGALEGLKEIARIEAFKDKVANSEQRANVLRFMADLLDQAVETELKEAYEELKRYFA